MTTSPKGTVWGIYSFFFFLRFVFIIFVLSPPIASVRVSERACIRYIFVHINIVRCSFYVFSEQAAAAAEGPRRPPDTFVKGDPPLGFPSSSFLSTRGEKLTLAARHLTHLPTCPINLNKCHECKPTVFPCLCETIFTVSIKDLFTAPIIQVRGF